MATVTDNWKVLRVGGEVKVVQYDKLEMAKVKVTGVRRLVW